MRTIAFVIVSALAAPTFAAPAAAQERRAPRDPRVELAGALAVEEQERDLAKAEAAYRAALARVDLSAAARALASRRLAGVLQRLGREDEAKPFAAAAAEREGAVVTSDDVTAAKQDAEREKELRAKARAVVQRVVARSPVVGDGSLLTGLPRVEAEQLLWLGESAVPEVIAALEAASMSPPSDSTTLRALASFLWRVGNAQAQAFLRAAMEHEVLREVVAAGAYGATTPPMLDLVIDLLRNPQPGVAAAIVNHSYGSTPSLLERLDPRRVVLALAEGAAEQRRLLLWWANRLTNDKRYERIGDALPKLIAVAREALRSTDPAVATAARGLVQSSSYLQQNVEGVELVLEHLPNPLFATQQTVAFPERVRFTVDEARRLLPRVDACVRAIGRLQQGDQRQGWLLQIMYLVAEPLDASIAPQLLAWAELGFTNVLGAARGKITSANAAGFVAVLDRCGVHEQNTVLEALAAVDLPAEVFPALRERAAARMDAAKEVNELVPFAMPIARTGHPEAGAWLVEQMRRVPASQRDPRTATQLQRTPAWQAVNRALVALARRSPSPAVFELLRREAADAATPSQERAALLLALLANGDTATLSLLPTVVDGETLPHPYSADPANAPKTTVLGYVLAAKPQPPHPFTEAQVLEFVRGMAAWRDRVAGRHAIDPVTLSDRVLMELVEHVWLGGNEAAMRINHEPAGGPWHVWLDRVLAQPIAARIVISDLDDAQIARIRPRLDALLAADDVELAEEVLRRLADTATPPDFRALLTSRHAEIQARSFRELRNRGVELTDEELVRLLATMPEDGRDKVIEVLGDRAAVAAVPALLPLLRDDGVRESAAKALDKIRFFHEQQAHWDRVLKGLDASPGSALEKLLLQGKPGAPKPQRLLALPSLGLLGAPEALPFLIEWAQDADAEIAVAAQAAITQIHLHPRK